MSGIVEKLRLLNVGSDDFVTLNYSDGTDVWHINESHIEETVAETETAAMLGGLLASGLPVSSTYGETDILAEMRDNGELEDYDREDWFAQYLTEVLTRTIYDGEYSLDYSTEQYDYKRGFCTITAEVRLRAGDLYKLETDLSTFVTADSVVSGFEVTVTTSQGTLKLD